MEKGQKHIVKLKFLTGTIAIREVVMIVDSKYPKDNITELNICHSKLSMTEYKF